MLLWALTWGQVQGITREGGERAFGPAVSLPVLFGRVVNIGLGLLGLVFLCYCIYAGYKWMTARGSEKDVSDAKETLKNSIIGLILIAVAYAISSFITSEVFNVVQDAAPEPNQIEVPANDGVPEPNQANV